MWQILLGKLAFRACVATAHSGKFVQRALQMLQHRDLPNATRN